MARSKPAEGLGLCSASMVFMQAMGRFVMHRARPPGDIVYPGNSILPSIGKDRAMRLTIEIVATALLVFCISASSAAFAAGKMGRSADGLGCSFSVAKSAPPAARCAAIKRQCGGKFAANYCGDRLLSAM
jgi:hypothetical protein